MKAAFRPKDVEFDPFPVILTFLGAPQLRHDEMAPKTAIFAP